LRQAEFWHAEFGLALDLHWNVTHGEMPFPLSFDDIWAERRKLSCNGVRFAVASPEWLFVLSSLYLVKSYPWPELIYLSDAARLVQRFPQLDWDRVDAIARQTGTRRICAVSLA